MVDFTKNFVIAFLNLPADAFVSIIQFSGLTQGEELLNCVKGNSPEKVGEQGEKEKELHEKFICYSKTNGGALDSGISAAYMKIPAVSPGIKALRRTEGIKWRRIQTGADLLKCCQNYSG